MTSLAPRTPKPKHSASKKIELLAALSVGLVGGVALVAACGDAVSPSSAQETPDGASNDAGGGAPSCGGGACTVSGPIAVSGVASPVTVVATQPLPVTGTVSIGGTPTVSLAGPLTLSGPVTISGTPKMVTADTDPAQLVSGTTQGWAGTVRTVGVGPLIITDATCSAGLIGAGTSPPSCFIEITSGSTCPTSLDVLAAGIAVDPASSMHGGRFLVPAGSVACAVGNNGGVYWAGFRPY